MKGISFRSGCSRSLLPRTLQGVYSTVLVRLYHQARSNICPVRRLPRPRGQICPPCSFHQAQPKLVSLNRCTEIVHIHPLALGAFTKRRKANRSKNNFKAMFLAEASANGGRRLQHFTHVSPPSPRRPIEDAFLRSRTSSAVTRNDSKPETAQMIFVIAEKFSNTVSSPRAPVLLRGGGFAIKCNASHRN